MKKIGIIIDDWKLPIFKEHLDRAGYPFKKAPGIVPGTLTLKVNSELIASVQKVVEQANEAARKQGKPK